MGAGPPRGRLRSRPESPCNERVRVGGETGSPGLEAQRVANSHGTPRRTGHPRARKTEGPAPRLGRRAGPSWGRSPRTGQDESATFRREQDHRGLVGSRDGSSSFLRFGGKSPKQEFAGTLTSTLGGSTCPGDSLLGRALARSARLGFRACTTRGAPRL